MEFLTLTLSAVLGFCLMFYNLLIYLKPYARMKEISNFKRILLVISHPDDETMFFGPTILGLLKQKGVEVFVLCLSMGNYKNKGPVRKNELYKACEVLGIRDSNITILKYTKLKDDPSLRWREELISEIVYHQVVANNYDAILTFDRHGISGHKNHSSVYKAMILLAMEKKLPSSFRIFSLKSVNLLRKYSSILDIPMSFIFSSTAYVANVNEWFTLRKAMSKHKSQFVWFRQLYFLFSRYTLINTFDQIGSETFRKLH